MRAFLVAALAAGVGLLSGCGGPRAVPVSGSVTYRGTGVADVNVVFYGPNNVIGRASTDAQGNFASVTWQRPGDGLPPGTYKVTVVPKSETKEEYGPPPPPPFPKKYVSLETTDLSVTIAPPASKVQLELKD
ncbi:MAG: carboxypeptidase-like regulatory domain-containing protein [Thermoguttaceae bacterium]|nr:carboxypeptidase-like regulatory domain-containing protein [Thermoguttaceae bacterium]MDW8079627.1 carboxypeptidase-like regulatory domain-containing protein [Thermoguttaceae bacterium]